MQPTSAITNPATAEFTTPNPVKPVVITIIGLVVGVLSMVQAYFGSGHIPSAAEVSGLLGGAGISLGSVAGFLSHHLGVNKAMLLRDAAVIAASRPTPNPVTTALAPAPPPGS